MKTAFYPCCNNDIIEPLKLLTGYVDRVIFCDINQNHSKNVKKIMLSDEYKNLPECMFIAGDALTIIDQLPPIDLLFYRRDSTGEGGSGLFILGDIFLKPFLKKLSADGGLIFTDGSNSRGGNFKKMTRTNGLIKHGWKFSKSDEQPYLVDHHLYKINVIPA